MEARGKVNCYEPVSLGKDVYVVNLSAGVTPFIRHFNDLEYGSVCYNLRRPVSVTITHANYRPTKEEFDTLDAYSKDHVLNGGLLCAELTKARPLPDDPVDPTWSFDRFLAFCETTYGVRRPRPDWLPPEEAANG